MTNTHQLDAQTDIDDRLAALSVSATQISAKDIKLPISGNGSGKRRDAQFWREFGFDIFPLAPDKVDYDGDPETHFDRHPDHAIGCTVPNGIVVYGEAEGGKGLRSVAQDFPVPPRLFMRCDGYVYYAYRTDEHGNRVDPSTLPDGVMVLQSGDLLRLPSQDDFTGDYKVLSLDGLTFLRAPIAAPEVHNTPLSRFSLRGQAPAFADNAVVPVSLLGQTVMMGQATLWYLIMPPWLRTRAG